jgi:hypothetical protein
MRETFETAPTDGSFVADRSECHAPHGVTVFNARDPRCGIAS